MLIQQIEDPDINHKELSCGDELFKASISDLSKDFVVQINQILTDPIKCCGKGACFSIYLQFSTR